MGLPGAWRGRKVVDMPRKAAVPPPPEIADRIKREVATPGFLSDLIAWADRQCGKLMSIEDRIDPHKALDLVNAAVVESILVLMVVNVAISQLYIMLFPRVGL